MSYNTKTHEYPTRAEAFNAFTAATNLARDKCKIRNEEDPDLNETVETSTDEVNKRFILTRPDMQEGVVIIHYVWAE